MNWLEVWSMKLPYRRRMIEGVTANYFREFAEGLTGKEVLEIGCGHGFGAQAIMRDFSPSKITATDLDPRMITSAKRSIKDPSIIFEVADATKLPYEDSRFAAVFEYGAIHHVPGPLWKTCLEEIYRVLSAGGKVFLYDNSLESFTTGWGLINRLISHHPYDSMYKKRELTDHLRYLGLNVLKEADLGRYFVVIAEKTN